MVTNYEEHSLGKGVSLPKAVCCVNEPNLQVWIVKGLKVGRRMRMSKFAWMALGHY